MRMKSISEASYSNKNTVALLASPQKFSPLNKTMQTKSIPNLSQSKPSLVSNISETMKTITLDEKHRMFDKFHDPLSSDNSHDPNGSTLSIKSSLRTSMPRKKSIKFENIVSYGSQIIPMSDSDRKSSFAKQGYLL